MAETMPHTMPHTPAAVPASSGSSVHSGIPAARPRTAPAPSLTARLTAPFFFLLLLLTACSKADEEEDPWIIAIGDSTFEVMVAFAPGQLGDRGFADNVMEGVNLLTFLQDQDGSEILNVHFISPWDFSALKQAIGRWAADDKNPLTDSTYHRRLLVLTEPYMIHMLHTAKPLLRPTDEVLLLKVNDDDVKAAAQQLGMPGRVHGLNISAAYSVRRYCHYMKELAFLRQRTDDKLLNMTNISYFRLYNTDFNICRDSVYETLIQELGADTEIRYHDLSDESGEGIFIPDHQITAIEEAYFFASAQQYLYELTGQAFAVCDLGSANAGWDYWLMSRSATMDTFHTLMLDANEAPLSFRIYIKRYFGIALSNWCYDWAREDIGTMPQITIHTGEDWAEDNIPDPKFYH